MEPLPSAHASVQSGVAHLQVIALITHLVEARKEHGRYLVVVPASVLPHWLDEIGRFSPGLKVAAYTGPFEERTEVWQMQVRRQGNGCMLQGFVLIGLVSQGGIHRRWHAQ